jgi:hypothetical protein
LLLLYLEGGGVEMERSGEKAKTEESARGSVGPVGWLGAQRGQAEGQSGKWSKGGSGQKPQEDHRCASQCTPATAWTPPQESLNVLVEKIRARFGEYAIGRGDGGIRYSVSTLR